MALTRVQATPKVTAAFSPGSVAVVFGTPPAVGNGIVVPVTSWSGGPPTGAVDNYGNAYTVGPTIIQGGVPRASILYCPKIVASGASFTVTVSGPAPYWTEMAIEVAGVGSGLILDQSATQGGTSIAASTGATPALTADEVFLVAVLSTQSGQNFITVESVSPAWTEEWEELPASRSPGEADSRIRIGVLGTTQSCSWTLWVSDVYAALVAAFKPGVVVSTTPTRLSQLPIEILRGGQAPPALRVSQLPVEVLRGGQALPALRLSQLPIEVLRSATTAEAPTVLRLSQLPIEVLRQVPAAPLAATQLVVETLATIPNSPLAVTQVAAELLKRAEPAEARVTQLACELIVIAYEPPACSGSTATFPIDPDD